MFQKLKFKKCVPDANSTSIPLPADELSEVSETFDN